MIKKCLNCSKEFEAKSCKFCCMKCYHYYSYRNDAEYKAKRKAESKRYYNNNRELCCKKAAKYFQAVWLVNPANRKKFNAQMRDISREYQRKVRLERADKGLCIMCGAPRDTVREYNGKRKILHNCSKCLEKFKLKNKNK